jgi:tetratricopeptide (TPR) repeat protein
LRVAPDNPDVLTVMALWSAIMGKPKDEETYSRKAIASNSDSITAITARLYLGEALQAQNKLDEAAQEYRQLLAIEPDNYDARNDLGINLGRQGLTQEALKEFWLSLAIQPDQAIPHAEIGRIFLTETHQLPKAVDEFTQALRFNPADVSVHKDLGMALLQLGDYEKAVEQFSYAIRIDPAYVDAKKNLDLAQARMKNEKVQKGRK